MDHGNDGTGADLLAVLCSYADTGSIEAPTLTRFVQTLAEASRYPTCPPLRGLLILVLPDHARSLNKPTFGSGILETMRGRAQVTW